MAETIGPIGAICPNGQYERRPATFTNYWNGLEIKVIFDPSDEFRPGARFSKESFRMTLQLGYWPNGLIIRIGSKYYIVRPCTKAVPNAPKQASYPISKTRAELLQNR